MLIELADEIGDAMGLLKDLGVEVLPEGWVLETVHVHAFLAQLGLAGWEKENYGTRSKPAGRSKAASNQKLGLLLLLGVLLWRVAGSTGLLVAAGAIVITFIAALLFGRSQRQGKANGVFFSAAMLSLAATSAFAFSSVTPKESGAAQLYGQSFSVAALDAAKASGKPVFVYFTADWCVTCKVNEGAAINRSETDAAFRANDVQVLVADWTKGDAEITRVLAEHGRNSVPLYLWYKPGASEPEILPQILTPSMLTERAAQK